MSNSFDELSISNRKTEKLSNHFDGLMDLATSSRWDVDEAVELSDEKYTEIMKQAKKLALDNTGGFQNTNDCEPQEAEIQDGKIPIKGIKDVDAFQSWLINEEDLSRSTVHDYRNALKRFYYFTSQKHGRNNQIQIDGQEHIDELRTQLDGFVVSKNNERGMKKYMEFYADQNPEQKEEAEKTRDYIHNKDYKPEDELEININS